MPFFLMKQDITTCTTDAIVNAANTALKMGGGVCGAIFKVAGVEQMQKACAHLSPIEVGEAVLTDGFNLPAKYVIHSAGPVYKDGKSGEEEKLKACYTNSLKLAQQHHCKSIAFPLISSGIYGYPKSLALKAATDAIQHFLQDHEMEVTLVLFEPLVLPCTLLSDVQQYLDAAYDPSLGLVLLAVEDQAINCVSQPSMYGEPEALKQRLKELDEPFSDTLLRVIREKGRTEVEVYKKANLDRKHFSKIRTGNGYLPSKKTIVALAIALELDLGKTEWLLGLAGYSFSHASKFDVIVEYFLTEKIYDIFTINEVLFSYDQQLLGK